MKLLIQYLKPYKLLVLLALGLAAINQVFSLMDPIVFGNIIDLAYRRDQYTQDSFLRATAYWLSISVGVAVTELQRHFKITSQM